MNKGVIEEGSAELVELFDKVSDEAKIEKNAIPPINKLIYWWTRKPLIVSRAVSLSATLQKSSDLKSLLKLDSDKRAYRTDCDIGLYTKKLGRDPSTIKVLDAFAGAGNLLFESKKLGLDCYSMDYNPVAYLIEKATLEYPSKYGERLADDVEKYGKQVIELARKEIGRFYEREKLPALNYLWAWCIRCPFCDQRMPLMNQMGIVQTDKKKMALSVRAKSDLDFDLKLLSNASQDQIKLFTQKGGKAACIKCKNSISYDQLSTDMSKKRDHALVAIVSEGSNTKEYNLPSDEDRQNYAKAKNYLKKVWDEYEQQGLIPKEDILASHRRENLLWHYGMKKWYQFFNDRQLLAMLTVLKNIKLVSKEIKDKEYAGIIATYLAFMLAKHVNSNCLGLSWNKKRESVDHALLPRRPSMVYNFAEVNPFKSSRGSLSNVLDNITNAIKFASLDKHEIRITLSSALHIPYPDNTFDLVITDPPYGEDVQYAELSEFFYVWLYRALKDYYPELPERAPLDEDASEAWGRFGDKKVAKAFYAKALKAAFKDIGRVLKHDGLLVVFFSHSQTEMWNLLLDVLRESQIMVTSSYAVQTESNQNPLARGKAAFMSSILVSCRKISAESEAYFEDLVPQMEDKVRELVTGISPDKLVSLPMTDLLIMVYGEVLEIATRHTKIKSFSPDFKPDFEVLISQAREQIMKEVLKRVLGKSPNILGREISFYTIARLFYRGQIAADEAIKLNKAYGIQSSDLEEGGMVDIKDGNMNLLGYDEVILNVKQEEIASNNLYQQLICLEKTAAEEGANKVRKLLALHNFRASDLAPIVSLLVKSYTYLQNKGEELGEDEAKEFKVLQAIADVLGIADSTASNMDRFLQK